MSYDNCRFIDCCQIRISRPSRLHFRRNVTSFTSAALFLEIFIIHGFEHRYSRISNLVSCIGSIYIIVFDHCFHLTYQIRIIDHHQMGIKNFKFFGRQTFCCSFLYTFNILNGFGKGGFKFCNFVCRNCSVDFSITTTGCSSL